CGPAAEWWALLLRLERFDCSACNRRIDRTNRHRSPADPPRKSTRVVSRSSILPANGQPSGLCRDGKEPLGTCCRTGVAGSASPTCAHARTRQSGHCRQEYSARARTVKATAVWSLPRQRPLCRDSPRQSSSPVAVSCFGTLPRVTPRIHALPYPATLRRRTHLPSHAATSRTPSRPRCAVAHPFPATLRRRAPDVSQRAGERNPLLRLESGSGLFPTHKADSNERPAAARRIVTQCVR